jgi:hypothetical protein
MRRLMHCFILGVLLCAVAEAADRPECSTGARVPNPAVNCPDRFAWEKFVEVVTPVAGGGGLVTFQTYSTDSDTFQCPAADLETCRKNPNAPGCPVWPATGKAAQPERFTQRSARVNRGGGIQMKRSHLTGDDCWNVPNTEIVYRNRATFDYIVKHGLWYVEGIQAQFERGFVYDFPTDALEVKTNWIPLSADQVASGRWYTMQQGGQTLGLIAMHISTKDLPNWFWSTFEHVDNLGRCDFLGCHDSFGFTPHDIPARPRELCETYPAGEITKPLAAMMVNLPPVFQNYRLKGSMTDFTTATGSPILVGNSVTEAGFVQTASCMTCHARAAVQATPQGPNGLSPYPGIAGFTPEGQSYNGTPNPNWYYSGNDPVRRWAVQTDFVWAIPFKANAVASTQQCCAALAAGTGGPCQCQGEACQ